MNDDYLADLTDDLVAFEAVATIRPLTTWRAWHKEPPATSQLSVMQELENTHELTVFGGNRSGKTELCRSILIALAAGSDHPDARQFWENHDMDPAKFPKGPDAGWAIACTSNDSLRYHRKQVLAMIPKWGPRHPMSEGAGSNWHAWNLFGRGEARIEFMVPGYPDPAQIWFKSEDQGKLAFQGDAVRAIHHDEEGKTGVIYEQCRYRLIDKDGYQLFSDTPINGKSWVYNKFVAEKPPGMVVRHLHALDNPYLPAHRVAAYGNDAVRGKGMFEVTEGRIWPSFSEANNVIQAQIVPAEVATRFRLIDFGTRHPFACLWLAFLRKAWTTAEGRRLPEDTAVIYREHYQAGWTLGRHVAAMRRAEGWELDEDRIKALTKEDLDSRPDLVYRPSANVERFEITWADPEDPQMILQLNTTHNMPTIAAIKSRSAGFDMVESWLRPDLTGAPRLIVMSNCPNTIREWGDYQWTTEMTAEGVEKQVPSKKSDHTCDLARYAVLGLTRAYGLRSTET